MKLFYSLLSCFLFFGTFAFADKVENLFVQQTHKKAQISSFDKNEFFSEKKQINFKKKSLSGINQVDFKKSESSGVEKKTVVKVKVLQRNGSGICLTGKQLVVKQKQKEKIDAAVKNIEHLANLATKIGYDKNTFSSIASHLQAISIQLDNSCNASEMKKYSDQIKKELSLLKKEIELFKKHSKLLRK